MPRSFAQYRAEAQGLGFCLDIGAGRALVIPRPDVDALFSLSECATTDEALRVLAGAQADALLEALRPEDFTVAVAVLHDLRSYFGADDMPRLTWLIDRYGEAIEADLRKYYHGVRLLDVFNGGMTPREALVYIDGLPSDSLLAEAMSQDEEMAERFAGGEPAKWRPKVTEYGATNRLLAVVADRLGEVLGAIAAFGGGTVRVEPLPSPETAAERLAARVTDAGYDYILERIAEARKGLE